VAPAGSSSSSRGSSHYLSNTSGCGQAVREQLRVSFSALYQYLTTLLVAPAPHPTDIITCGHVLNFWCLNFKPEDHPFLTQTHILVHHHPPPLPPPRATHASLQPPHLPLRAGRGCVSAC
jgi:hypothetical protein